MEVPQLLQILDNPGILGLVIKSFFFDLLILQALALCPEPIDLNQIHSFIFFNLFHDVFFIYCLQKSLQRFFFMIQLGLQVAHFFVGLGQGFLLRLELLFY